WRRLIVAHAWRNGRGWTSDDRLAQRFADLWPLVRARSGSAFREAVRARGDDSALKNLKELFLARFPDDDLVREAFGVPSARGHETAAVSAAPAVGDGQAHAEEQPAQPASAAAAVRDEQARAEEQPAQECRDAEAAAADAEEQRRTADRARAEEALHQEEVARRTAEIERARAEVMAQLPRSSSEWDERQLCPQTALPTLSRYAATVRRMQRESPLVVLAELGMTPVEWSAAVQAWGVELARNPFLAMRCAELLSAP
ncbi:MAG: hypothetical protein ACK4N5_16355, partial [Myxococcales bacterium]